MAEVRWGSDLIVRFGTVLRGREVIAGRFLLASN